MIEPKHTPGLWRVGKSEWDGTEFWTIEDPSGAVICQEPTGFAAYESGAFITPGGQVENANFIALACNAHDELVEVLQDIAAGCPHHPTTGPRQRNMQQVARAALAKATGQEVTP